MIEGGMRLDDSTIGIWCIEFPGGNFVGTLCREPDGFYSFVYRFRYFKDDRAFASMDQKNWYGYKVGGNAADAINTISEITALMLADGFGTKRYEHLRGSMTYDDYREAFFKLPWVNVIPVHPEGHA